MFRQAKLFPFLKGIWYDREIIFSYVVLYCDFQIFPSKALSYRCTWFWSFWYRCSSGGSSESSSFGRSDDHAFVRCSEKATFTYNDRNLLSYFWYGASFSCSLNRKCLRYFQRGNYRGYGQCFFRYDRCCIRMKKHTSVSIWACLCSAIRAYCLKKDGIRTPYSLTKRNSHRRCSYDWTLVKSLVKGIYRKFSRTHKGISQISLVYDCQWNIFPSKKGSTDRIYGYDRWSSRMAERRFGHF